MELSWIYAFNIIVNSLLSFFTTIFLIELCLLCFRIQQPRVRALCRSLPFFKICLDLSLYQFTNWALMYGVNPMLAETGTRRLSLLILNPWTGIELRVQDGKTFSLADVMALSMDPLWIRGVVYIAITGSIVAISVRLVQMLREKKHLSQILQGASLIPLPLLNSRLASWITKRGITFAVSTQVTSPCIARKTILFPASLMRILSPEEIQAVIAHELAHDRWKDGHLRLFCACVGSIFWWIPSKWWQKRIEDTQEIASDAMVDRFGISRLALAKAVLKTAERAKGMQGLVIPSFVGLRLKKRMQWILHEPLQPVAQWRYVFLLCSSLSILLGRLWIF